MQLRAGRGHQDQTELEYDAEQTRVIKRSPTATTIYVNGHYERAKAVGSGVEEHKYKVFAGDRQVAQILRTVTPGPGGPPTLQELESYLHDDLLGSVTAISNADGSEVHRQEFDPFGLNAESTYTEEGGASFANRVQPGFTGHIDEPDIGLVDMSGRFYDPAIGRFLTADPFVQAPLFSQSLNRYSYVMCLIVRSISSTRVGLERWDKGPMGPEAGVVVAADGLSPTNRPRGCRLPQAGATPRYSVSAMRAEGLARRTRARTPVQKAAPMAPHPRATRVAEERVRRRQRAVRRGSPPAEAVARMGRRGADRGEVVPGRILVAGAQVAAPLRRVLRRRAR